MPFHFSQFASTRVEDALQTKLLQLPDFPADLRHCLLTGPEHSGRTALLFHYAYSRAATGEHIVFITRTKAVEREPPVLPAGVTKDDEAFGRIHMRYLETLTDIRKFVASLHILEHPPAALIVDDLAKFEDEIPGDRQRELIATLSYLHDATQWAGKRRADKECMLLISEVASPEGPRMLFLYQRWCPLILMIAATQGETARLMLVPSVFDHHDISPANSVGLDFSVAKHSALALEGITRLA